MAESMSGQIVSIACALSKADEGENFLYLVMPVRIA